MILKNYKVQKHGLLSQNDNKFTKSNILIELKANEEKTYFLKASSEITTLIINLKLWDDENFMKKR